MTPLAAAAAGGALCRPAPEVHRGTPGGALLLV